jgi:NAD(P)-dependent dehydrogenase (short-subunit alcohol dehydrogenase family)
MVAVVTGAAGLIGAQISASLRAEGATVIGVDRLAAPAGDADWECVDVTDSSALAGLAARIDAAHGRVDCLVHAAALTGRAGRTIAARLEVVPISLWDETLRANLTSALICVQALLPLLRRAADPSIVLIGSIQGLVPTADHTGAYAVSKTALIGLTRQLAAELAADGITVNMLSPGPTLDGAEVDTSRRARDGNPTPLGRFGTAQELGAAVVALVGPAFRHCTGAVIPIDGGEHLRPRGGPERLSQRAAATPTPDTHARESR